MNSKEEETAGFDKVYGRRWAILAVMSLSLVIVILNNVTLNVALPELSKDLKADNTDLQWMMDAYALIFGGTLLVMGALGDRFGRKPALQLGLIIVAVASAAITLTPKSKMPERSGFPVTPPLIGSNVNPGGREPDATVHFRVEMG